MSDAGFVFLVIAIAGALMASNRVRFDVIAIGVMLALMLSETLTVSQALAGFGQSVVIMVAGLLVVGEMLERTGVARTVGDWILAKGGTNKIQLLALIMLSAAILGSAMSSTAIVAIFIPIVLRIAKETGHSSRQLLLPMSYAALISGMLTLIATPPNLVVSAELAAAGFTPLSFFSFTPIGFAVLAGAIAYMLLVGRWLLPAGGRDEEAADARRPIEEIWREFRGDEAVEFIEITRTSSLVGQRVGEADLHSRFGARVLARLRHGDAGEEKLDIVTARMELREGDLVAVSMLPDDLQRLVAETSVRVVPIAPARQQRLLWQAGAATVLIHPEGDVVGLTLVELDFRQRYGVQVLGIRRDREVVGKTQETALRTGDQLLVVGTWSDIEQLEHSKDFILLETPAERERNVPNLKKAPLALGILAAMVGASVLDLIPLVSAVLLAAVAAVASGCLTATQAYRSIQMTTIVLIAGMLPLADALQQTGGSDLIVDGLLEVVGDGSPTAMMVLLFALTAALGLILSNTASAVLVAPIALTAAAALGVSPYPFAIAVLIAASAAFSTPVSTPVVTLVVEPGRYAFTDFVKAGVPLLVLTGVITVVLTPLLFPF